MLVFLFVDFFHSLWVNKTFYPCSGGNQFWLPSNCIVSSIFRGNTNSLKKTEIKSTIPVTTLLPLLPPPPPQPTPTNGRHTVSKKKWWNTDLPCLSVEACLNAIITHGKRSLFPDIAFLCKDLVTNSKLGGISNSNLSSLPKPFLCDITKNDRKGDWWCYPALVYTKEKTPWLSTKRFIKSW